MDNVRLSIVKGSEGELKESIIENYIARRFKFSASDQVVKNLDNFLNTIKEKFGSNITISRFKQGFGTAIIYIHKSKNIEKISDTYDDFLFYIQAGKKEALVEVYANSIEETCDLYNFVFEHSDNEEVMKIQMHNYFFEGRLTHDTSILKAVDLEQTDGDFYSDFTDTDILFEQFSKAKENILILCGDSGIGKTKLATHYMHFLLKHPEVIKRNDIQVKIAEFDFNFQGDETDIAKKEESKLFINVAYVKNEDILAMDKFWVALRRNAYDIVILDDLDYYLTPRAQVLTTKEEIEKNKFISNFLSFTDGIIPSKTKFIIATNRGVDSIDEALRRDGRLFRVFELSKLTNEEGLNIWLKYGLDEDSFDLHFGNSDEILQAKLGSLITSYKNNENTSPVSFLKEGSKADISDKFLQSKKVGFIGNKKS